MDPGAGDEVVERAGQDDIVTGEDQHPAQLGMHRDVYILAGLDDLAQKGDQVLGSFQGHIHAPTLERAVYGRSYLSHTYENFLS